MDLVEMRRRKPVEHLLRLRRQGDQDTATVAGVGLAVHESQSHQPIDQLDHAVVAQQKLIRQLAHREIVPDRVALDRQQGLVLLRRQARRACRTLAEMEKVA